MGDMDKGPEGPFKYRYRRAPYGVHARVKPISPLVACHYSHNHIAAAILCLIELRGRSILSNPPSCGALFPDTRSCPNSAPLAGSTGGCNGRRTALSNDPLAICLDATRRATLLGGTGGRLWPVQRAREERTLSIHPAAHPALVPDMYRPCTRDFPPMSLFAAAASVSKRMGLRRGQVINTNRPRIPVSFSVSNNPPPHLT